MKQPWWLLLVGFLAASSMSLKLVQCSKSTNEIHNTSCYDTRSVKTCFTTFFTTLRHPVRMSFENASDWCKAKVPGSSLLVIKSAEDQQIVQDFIGSQALENETIIMDARKLSIHESQNWSWVNGHQIIPSVSGDNRLTAVALNFHQNLPAYLLLSVVSSSRYICEFSGSMPTFSYKHNNKIYAASQTVANWYDARNKCLRLGGDLASITDLKTIGNWSCLTINYGYWIGLHRNMWIWNSTGAAISYTNWEGGYPDESSDKQCICINPRCRRENNGTICGYDRKWRTCNCNHNYTIVCQKQEDSNVSTTEIVVTEEILSSISKDFKSSCSFPVDTSTNSKGSTPASASLSITATSSTINRKLTESSNLKTISTRTYPATTPNTTTIGEIDGKTASSSSMTQNPSNHFAENQTTALESSTGLFNTKEILLVILFLVVVVFIFAAVIVIIRKRKYDRRNEEAYMRNTEHIEAVSSVYTTVVPVNNRPSEGTVPPDNTIYSEVEMIQQPTPPSNNTIYASVQPTSETVDMGNSVDYADLDFPRKHQQKPRSVDKITSCLSPIYSQLYASPTSASYTEHEEPFKPDY